MRHFIDFDKLINRLVPYYLGGRRYILLLQGILAPLRWVNDRFVEWAIETRIEASMTSCVFQLEWFLNRKFRRYFLNGVGQITVGHRTENGIPMFYESAHIDQEEHPVIYQESEQQAQPLTLFHRQEQVKANDVSFTVYSPPIDTTLITPEAYIAMLSHEIDKYRLAGKTYHIKMEKR